VRDTRFPVPDAGVGGAGEDRAELLPDAVEVDPEEQAGDAEGEAERGAPMQAEVAIVEVGSDSDDRFAQRDDDELPVALADTANQNAARSGRRPRSSCRRASATIELRPRLIATYTMANSSPRRVYASGIAAANRRAPNMEQMTSNWSRIVRGSRLSVSRLVYSHTDQTANIMINTRYALIHVSPCNKDCEIRNSANTKTRSKNSST
jgi:hypothetical protein